MLNLAIGYEPFRLVTYSHDGYGLGHLRRTSNIAARFVQDTPGSTALMLTGCPVGNVFLLPKGVDFIKVPSLIKVDNGVYDPLGLRIDRKKAKAIRASTILTAVTQFKPHLFLVDHVPAGIYGELLPTLRMLKKLDDPPVIVLGLRDIIDEPNVVCELWRKEMTYQAIRKYYDDVFIYGCKEIFDGALHYGMEAEFPGKVRYCGYVCSEPPLKSREQVREDVRLRKENLVVVTAGGGHDAYPLMQSCMEAVRLVGRDAPFEVFFITGPLMDPAQREQLREQARGLAVRVITSVEDPSSFINAADLVITMAGYNSICEVVSLRRKALVVPRLGPRAEQQMRARLFQERGLIDVLGPREASARNLAERIMVDLKRTGFPTSAAAVDMAGSSKAAGRLLQLALERPAFRPVTLSRVVGAAARLVRRLEESLDSRGGAAEFIERVGRRFVLATSTLTIVMLLGLMLPSSGPFPGPASDEPYFAQPEPRTQNEGSIVAYDTADTRDTTPVNSTNGSKDKQK